MELAVASGESERIGRGFTMFPEGRKLRPIIPLGPGNGRAGLPAVSFGPSS